MIADLGHICILLSVALSAYSVVGSLLGAKLSTQQLIDSARLGGYLASAMLVLATAILIAAFVTQDFSIQYVAENSSTTMEPWLTWVAFYAGNEGSLLFLASIFSVLAGLAILTTPSELTLSLIHI